MALFRSISGEKCESSVKIEHTFCEMSAQPCCPAEYNNPQDYQLNINCEILKKLM
jgi:hypothetical protein